MNKLTEGHPDVDFWLIVHCLGAGRRGNPCQMAAEMGNWVITRVLVRLFLAFGSLFQALGDAKTGSGMIIWGCGEGSLLAEALFFFGKGSFGELGCLVGCCGVRNSSRGGLLAIPEVVHSSFAG